MWVHFSVSGQLRLVDVHNRVVAPVNTHTGMIAASVDVVHTWAVPSLGCLKTIAVPCRLRQSLRKQTLWRVAKELLFTMHVLPTAVQNLAFRDACRLQGSSVEERDDTG